MATAADVERLALAMEGTVSAPHVDRTAFKVVRIFATLAPDRLSLNLKLTPDEQEFKVLMAPAAFVALPNAWGKQGWTTLTLAAVNEQELESVLKMAWDHGRTKPARKR